MNPTIARRLAANAIASIAAGLAACAANGAAPAPDVVEVAITSIPEDAGAPTDESTLAAVRTARERKAELALRARIDAKNCCRGRNACKGQGNCKVSGEHGCKGKNDCKGHGGCAAADCLAKRRRLAPP